MRYIEHLVEPERLLLSWQTSIPGEDSQRMFVAELIRQGDDAKLVYLSESADFSRATDLGFDDYPGFDISKTVYENVLPSFMKRLPPRSRGDFGRFLGALRIRSDAEISDFALLGYSGAKLPDDDFTFIHPFENAPPPFELMVEVQGYQYYQDALPQADLLTDMQAFFEAEPDNPRDRQAIKILIGGLHVGYVCRGLTASFHDWIRRGLEISAYVERINGTEHKPKIYLYVSVK